VQEKSSEDDDLDEDDRRVVVVGVCAMAKKSNSRPMQEILERLVLFKDIRTFVFEESVILHVCIVVPFALCCLSCDYFDRNCIVSTFVS